MEEAGLPVSGLPAHNLGPEALCGIWHAPHGPETEACSPSLLLLDGAVMRRSWSVPYRSFFSL